mgnify:CR=1 FL=1
MTLGTPALVDLNGDGRVNDYYVFNAEGSTPHTQFGVTLGADWNGFDLELFFQGATGCKGSYAFSAPQPTKLYVELRTIRVPECIYTEQP